MTSGATEEPGAELIAEQIETGTVVCERQEPIGGLFEIARLLAHGIQKSSDVTGAFEGRCIGCGIRVDGADLLALSAARTAEPADDRESKIARLRIGYCARRTCDSRFYQIRCIAQPGVDWPTILAMKDGYVRTPESVSAGEDRKGRSGLAGGFSGLGERKWVMSGIVAVLILVLLAVWFQYWAGGSIPLLRQPEKFQVDPDPNWDEPR